jgi:hypothetical protein
MHIARAPHRRYNADLERVVRQRVRRGRHFPIMKVIPPGLDFSNLKIAPPPDPLSTGAARCGEVPVYVLKGGGGNEQHI